MEMKLYNTLKDITLQKHRKMEKVLEKLGKFVGQRKWERCIFDRNLGGYFGERSP